MRKVFAASLAGILAGTLGIATAQEVRPPSAVLSQAESLTKQVAEHGGPGGVGPVAVTVVASANSSSNTPPVSATRRGATVVLHVNTNTPWPQARRAVISAVSTEYAQLYRKAGLASGALPDGPGLARYIELRILSDLEVESAESVEAEFQGAASSCVRRLFVSARMGQPLPGQFRRECELLFLYLMEVAYSSDGRNVFGLGRGTGGERPKVKGAATGPNSARMQTVIAGLTNAEFTDPIKQIIDELQRLGMAIQRDSLSDSQFFPRVMRVWSEFLSQKCAGQPPLQISRQGIGVVGTLQCGPFAPGDRIVVVGDISVPADLETATKELHRLCAKGAPVRLQLEDKRELTVPCAALSATMAPNGEAKLVPFPPQLSRKQG